MENTEMERLKQIEDRLGVLEERVEALSRENAALRERLRALETVGELMEDVVDELIAEPIERV